MSPDRGVSVRGPVSNGGERVPILETRPFPVVQFSVSTSPLIPLLCFLLFGSFIFFLLYCVELPRPVTNPIRFFVIPRNPVTVFHGPYISHELIITSSDFKNDGIPNLV